MGRRRKPGNLTPREREVLELLRRGLTNQEIAARLDISIPGVKFHVSQILSRLGVGDREEAASLPLDGPKRWWSGWPLWASVGAGTAAVVTAATIALTLAVMDSSREQELVTVSPLVEDGRHYGADQVDDCNWQRYEGPAQRDGRSSKAAALICFMPARTASRACGKRSRTPAW